MSNFNISCIYRCAPDWESNNHLAYTWYWLIMGFLVPLIVIFFSSIQTVICLKKVIKLYYLVLKEPIHVVNLSLYVSFNDGHQMLKYHQH